MSRKVMIEMRASGPLVEAAFGLEPPGTPRTMAPVAAIPQLPGLQIDLSFPPAPIPRVREVPESRSLVGFSPFDVSTPFEMSNDPNEATFVLRGEVDDESDKNLRAITTQNPEVVGIYADVPIAPFLTCGGSPARGSDVDVERLLCVPRLRQQGMDGSGVLVAIVDTGVNRAYLQSHGKRPQFDAARSWAPAGGGVPGEQPVDHGTMCAYDVCIAAPNCSLIDLSVLRSRTPGGSAMEGLLSDAVFAYSRLLQYMQGPRRPGEARSLVVNNSWGMYHPSWDFPVGHRGNYSDNPQHPFNRIVASLERAGADILFAAGNCGVDCPDGRCEGVTSRAIYGANSHPQVLCVAGVDVTGTRVGYSTMGPGRLSREKPDLCGFTHFRGSGVYPSDGGTSAATPVVAGLVAALRSRVPFDPNNPATSPAAIRNLLKKTALERGAAGFDFAYGWGIVHGCRIASSGLLSNASSGAGVSLASPSDREAIEALVREMHAAVE